MYEVRIMLRKDFPAILQIEAASFDCPWDEEDLCGATAGGENRGLVIRDDQGLLGYAVYSWQDSNMEILNFAIHPDFRRRGLGTQLAKSLLEKLGRWSSGPTRTHFWLTVRETNVAAQLFFRSCGFKWVSTLQGIYNDTYEDAYRLCYRLGSEFANSVENQERENRVDRLNRGLSPTRSGSDQLRPREPGESGEEIRPGLGHRGAPEGF